MIEYLNYWKQNFYLGFQHMWKELAFGWKAFDVVVGVGIGVIFGQNNIILMGMFTIGFILGSYILISIVFSIFGVPFQEYKKRNKASAIGLLTDLLKEVQKIVKIPSNVALRRLIKDKLASYKRVGKSATLGQVIIWFTAKKYQTYEIISELQSMEKDKVIEISYTDKNKYIDPDLKITLLD